MDNTKKTTQCVIIGGGISGLTAAAILKKHDIRVTVLDKGRGIGGRLATRRLEDPDAGNGIFDYGAQFFTAKSSRFKERIDDWHQDNITKIWNHGFPSADGTVREDGVPAHIGVENMRSVAKHLARTLDVHTGTRVTTIRWLGNSWVVMTEEGPVFESNLIGLTAPVPQSLELLKRSSIVLKNELAGRLKNVRYQPCIAMLALLKQPSQIPEPGGIWLSGEPIAWMSDNWKKGVSPNGYAVTIHSGPEFSQKHWDEPDEVVAEKLTTAAEPFLGGDLARYQIHRWRYSQVTQHFNEACAYLEKPGPLFIFGDAFGGSRIEGAFLSGHSTAKQMLTILKTT